jgi:hypothetical protein
MPGLSCQHDCETPPLPLQTHGRVVETQSAHDEDAKACVLIKAMQVGRGRCHRPPHSQSAVLVLQLAPRKVAHGAASMQQPPAELWPSGRHNAAARRQAERACLLCAWGLQVARQDLQRDVALQKCLPPTWDLPQLTTAVRYALISHALKKLLGMGEALLYSDAGKLLGWPLPLQLHPSFSAVSPQIHLAALTQQPPPACSARPGGCCRAATPGAVGGRPGSPCQLPGPRPRCIGGQRRQPRQQQGASCRGCGVPGGTHSAEQPSARRCQRQQQRAASRQQQRWCERQGCCCGLPAGVVGPAAGGRQHTSSRAGRCPARAGGQHAGTDGAGVGGLDQAPRP